MLSTSKLMFLICARVAYSMIIIPERAEVTYIHPKHFAYANATVKKFSRKSPYYLNMEGENLVTVDSKLMFNAVVYQFVSNEYRRSFVEFHMPFCKLLNEPYFGGIFMKFGLKCPIIPGKYHFMNMTFPTENFPYVWPFEKCLFNITLEVDNVIACAGHIILKIIEKPKNRA